MTIEEAWESVVRASASRLLGMGMLLEKVYDMGRQR